MPVTITVPDIGGAEGAEVVEILVAVGDEIELEQSLIVLESDKASMEIPATAAGRVVELRVALGDALSEGDAVLVLESAGPEATEATPVAEGTSPEAAPPAVAAAPEVLSEEAVPATSENTGDQPESSPAGVATPVRDELSGTDVPAPSAEAGIYAGPAVRKLAREFGIDLAQLSGSGPRGASSRRICTRSPKPGCTRPLRPREDQGFPRSRRLILPNLARLNRMSVRGWNR